MIGKKEFMAAILLVVSIAMIAGCAGPAEKTVKAGDNVTVDYTGSYDNGSIFDTSNATIAKEAGIYNQAKIYEPMSFIVNSGQVIPGFDNAVVGMKVGESKNVTITPDQAYGQYNASLIRPVPLRILQEANITPHVNDTIYYNLQPVRIDHIVTNTTDVNNSSVYIDFNHPLAGKNLHFMVTVREINATK